MTKTCTACGREKTVDHFHRVPQKPDTFRKICRQCLKDRAQQRKQTQARYDTPDVHGYGHGV